MPTVCLVSPGHLGSNPRIIKEADALVAAGYHVHLVYAQTNRADLERDTSLLARAEWQALPVPCFAGTTTYRLQRVRQLVAQCLFRVAPWSLPLAIAAQHPASFLLRRAASSVRADLYIAHYVAALPAAASAARRHRGSYAFDAEDFHLGDWPAIPQHSWSRRQVRVIESALLPRCAYVSAASAGIAEAYQRSYGVPAPLVLRNVFPRTNAPTQSSRQGSVTPGPSLYWYSQTIGPNRGLECAIEALALCASRPHLYLRGSITPVYKEVLFAHAARHGVRSFLHLLPPDLPDEMERLAAMHDLGLVAETGLTQNRQIALTNKLFSYVLAGIPAVLSDIPAHQAIQAELGSVVKLFRTGDPASLAAAVDAYLLASPSERATVRAAAFRIGQQSLNWDCEKAVLLDRVASLLPVSCSA